MALQQQRVFNKLILFQRNAELEETEEKGENEEVERDAIAEIRRDTHITSPLVVSQSGPASQLVYCSKTR